MATISYRALREKCPECFNYMSFMPGRNGTMTGECPVCKAIVQRKQPHKNVKIIKVTTQKR